MVTETTAKPSLLNQLTLPERALYRNLLQQLPAQLAGLPFSTRLLSYGGQNRRQYALALLTEPHALIRCMAYYSNARFYLQCGATIRSIQVADPDSLQWVANAMIQLIREQAGA